MTDYPLLIKETARISSERRAVHREGNPETEIFPYLVTGCSLDAYWCWEEAYRKKGLTPELEHYLPSIAQKLNYAGDSSALVERLKTGELGLDGLDIELEIQRISKESVKRIREKARKLRREGGDSSKPIRSF